MVADIAYQHQTAPGQFERAAIGRGVYAIAHQATRHRLAALVERLLQRALHQPEPVAIGQHLVVGIDAGDRVLAILDRGDGRLQQHVGDTGGVLLTDRLAAIDDDFDVQTVMLQQHR